MAPDDQARFDALFEEVLENVPDGIRQLLDQVPVIVEDHPSPDLLRSLRADGVLPAEESPDDDLLCGLHTGFAYTELPMDDTGRVPSAIYLFRDGILSQAEGWKNDEEEAAVYKEIWITLLHEIGHQFGLSEEDLERLGYE